MENLSLFDEQQTMENEDSSSVTTGSKASKNDCYYLMEVNGYIEL